MQMYDGGYISLYRSLLNWDWYTDQNTKSLFIHLLLTVNYLPGSWKGRHIEVGQRVTSLAKLSQELNLSVKEIRTALQHLQKTGEVACETTNQYTVITVKNFVDFQSGAHKKTGVSASNKAGHRQAKGKPKASEGQQYNKGINNKGINNTKEAGGVVVSPVTGEPLPAIGQGDNSIIYAGERHLYPEEWESAAEDMGWTIEQYVRWKHQDGIYV